MPRISIVIPVYDMPNGDSFLKRCLDSIEKQTFKDYEVVITNDGKMAENTNSGIKKATGELIKILFMDDYLTHENSLQLINDNFAGRWLVTGCKHDPVGEDHLPSWNDNMKIGVNTIGSPSVLTIKNEDPFLFDESMTWLLDCDLYQRYYDKYGLPTILNDLNVTIGVGEHQATNRMGDQIKTNEYFLMQQKHG